MLHLWLKNQKHYMYEFNIELQKAIWILRFDPNYLLHAGSYT